MTPCQFCLAEGVKRWRRRGVFISNCVRVSPVIFSFSPQTEPVLCTLLCWWTLHLVSLISWWIGGGGGGWWQQRRQQEQQPSSSSSLSSSSSSSSSWQRWRLRWWWRHWRWWWWWWRWWCDGDENRNACNGDVCDDGGIMSAWGCQTFQLLWWQWWCLWWWR